jgi:hypothetical protein
MAHLPFPFCCVKVYPIKPSDTSENEGIKTGSDTDEKQNEKACHFFSVSFFVSLAFFFASSIFCLRVSFFSRFIYSPFISVAVIGMGHSATQSSSDQVSCRSVSSFNPYVTGTRRVSACFVGGLLAITGHHRPNKLRS